MYGGYEQQPRRMRIKVQRTVHYHARKRYAAAARFPSRVAMHQIVRAQHYNNRIQRRVAHKAAHKMAFAVQHAPVKGAVKNGRAAVEPFFYYSVSVAKQPLRGARPAHGVLIAALAAGDIAPCIRIAIA